VTALRSAIRAAGLRATPQRIAVLAIVRAARSPRSQDELAARLPATNDRSTTYRNLAALARAGLVRRVDIGDRLARFEDGRRPPHAHFVCTSCGDVACLAGTRVLAIRGTPRAIERGRIEIQIRGRCDKCHRVARGTTAQ
jgi:Fur family ferric uptake transcriptional regulator